MITDNGIISGNDHVIQSSDSHVTVQHGNL